MKYLIAVFLLVSLIGCKQTKTSTANAGQTAILALLNNSVVDTKLPLKLEDVNLQNRENIIEPSVVIKARLAETIEDYYKNECLVDSGKTNLTAKDVYIKTLSLRDSLQTIFLILLKHIPDDEVNSKVLFYDNKTQKFIGKTLDFNIHALYDFDKGKLKPTNLKAKFEIKSPEIEIINKGGVNKFEFTRLYHNGTANAVETVILKVSNDKIDTVDFKQKWIGNQ